LVSGKLKLLGFIIKAIPVSIFAMKIKDDPMTMEQSMASATSLLRKPTRSMSRRVQTKKTLSATS
jgi:hypothetical protein